MKRISAILAAVLILFTFCGCGDQEGGSDSSAEDVSSLTKEAVSQRTVVGEVDSIVGNEVTLLIGELMGPGAGGDLAMPEEGASAAESGEEASASDEAASGDAQTPPSGDFGGGDKQGKGSGEGMPAGGEAPAEGEVPTGGNLPAGGDTPAGGEGGGSVEIEYSGETGTYELPAGMTIGSGDFTDVTEGMILRLTFSTYEDGTEAISSVEILSR